MRWFNISKSTRGKSDGGLAAGGHCDLASMCSDALRAHLLCGLTREAREGAVGMAFTFVFERAKQIGSSSCKTQALCLREIAS